jgi:thiosulfate/3-mercaptopyruvate sulfurtransferase
MVATAVIPCPIRAACRQAGRGGRRQDTQVVAYDDAGGAFACRLWWLLRWLGHDRVAVLDGGIDRWRAEGQAVSPPIRRESCRRARSRSA